MARRTFVLLEIDLGGDVRRYIDRGAAVVTVTSRLGVTYHYETGAVITALPNRAADIFGGSASNAGASVTLYGDSILDLWEVSDRAPAQTVTGRLYWWREGDAYEDRREIHRGAIRQPTFEFHPGGLHRVSFSLEPPQRRGDIAFPPNTIGDAGRFPTSAENARTQPCPVIYGQAKGVPLYACTNVPPPPAPAVSPVRMMIAGHQVVAQSVAVRRSAGSLVANLAVSTAIDGLGGVYSYVTVPAATYNAEQNLHVTSVLGKPDPKAPTSPIDGLGDVLLDVWHSYSREDFFDLDRSRVYAAGPRLNRYKIGVAFNERVETGTLFDAMSSRFADAFPVVFNYTGGRLGWDATYLPDDDAATDPVWTLVYDQDAMDRGPVTETSVDEVRHAFLMQFGYDGFEQGETQPVTLDETNFGLARAALTRYGKAPLFRLRAPDVQDSGAAYVLLTDRARARTSVRRRVVYTGLQWEWNDYPLMSVGLVTDPDIGWDVEPFLIESIQPRLDGFVDVGVVSLRGR